MESHRRRFLRIAACALLGTLLNGCGEPNPLGRQAIVGQVTCDQGPLAAGVIAFEPLEPNGIASGARIQNGAYEIPAPQGLPPGKYRVRLNAARPLGELSADVRAGGPEAVENTETIAHAYNLTSQLTVEVKADGENRFDFDVESAR